MPSLHRFFFGDSMVQAKLLESRSFSEVRANSFTISLGSVVRELRERSGLTITELVIRGGASGRQLVNGKELTDLEKGTLDPIAADRLLKSGILTSLLRVSKDVLQRRAQEKLDEHLLETMATD